MKSFAFGQYYPVSSPIHSLDPRTKIILAVLYIVSAFICTNVFSYILLLLSVILLIALSRIQFSVMIRSIKPLLFIFLFTFVLNVFLTKGETILIDWWIIHIYAEGIANAVLLAVRIFVLVLGSSIFMTYTTTPIALTDGIESLLKPISMLGVEGVHTFAMMMSIALRFVPTLMDETQKIIAAQKSRGSDFESGGLMGKIKAMIPIIIPLFASAIHRAIELATAMECRCYHGGRGRTRFRVLKMRAGDYAALLIALLFIAAIVVLNSFGWIYNG